MRAGSLWLGKEAGLHAAAALRWLGVEGFDEATADFLVPRSRRSRTALAEHPHHRQVVTRRLRPHGRGAVLDRDAGPSSTWQQRRHHVWSKSAIDSAIRHAAHVGADLDVTTCGNSTGPGRRGTRLLRTLLLDSGGESVPRAGVPEARPSARAAAAGTAGRLPHRHEPRHPRRLRVRRPTTSSSRCRGDAATPATPTAGTMRVAGTSCNGSARRSSSSRPPRCWTTLTTSSRRCERTFLSWPDRGIPGRSHDASEVRRGRAMRAAGREGTVGCRGWQTGRSSRRTRCSTRRSCTPRRCA